MQTPGDLASGIVNALGDVSGARWLEPCEAADLPLLITLFPIPTAESGKLLRKAARNRSGAAMAMSLAVSFCAAATNSRGAA